MGSLGHMLCNMWNRNKKPSKKLHWWHAMYRKFYRGRELPGLVLVEERLNAVKFMPHFS